MTKREVFNLLNLISVYYDSFELQQVKVDEWFQVLRDESLQQLEKNLRKHVEYSPYPPKLSELLCKPASGSRAIPNGENTIILIQHREEPARKEIVEQSLAKIREILGIQRGEN